MSMIYPPPPQKTKVQFTPQIAKYDLPLKSVSKIYAPQSTRSNLPLKSPSTIYPPPPNQQGPIYPSIHQV